MNERGFAEYVNRMIQNIPMVVTGKLDGTECYQVQIDAAQSMELIMDYLEELGHEKIAFLGGFSNVISTAEKEAVYRRKLAGRGIELPEQLYRQEGPGYVRVELTATRRAQENMMPTAFIGKNEDTGAEELVMVFINEDILDVTFLLEDAEGYSKIAVYETSDAHDLECVNEGEWSVEQPITIAKMSVTTVVLTK